MALPDNALPYGLRDVKVTSIDAAGDYVDFVDLPAARTFSFTESEDFEELRGDDIVQAEHGNGPLIDWDLEQGGISLLALEIINGGAVTETGTTPNLIRTYDKLGTDARPYFQIEGQAINDNAGDTHVKVWRCKSTGDVGGEFSEGGFNMTSASGRGYPNQDEGDKLWSVIQHETATAIDDPTTP